MDAEQLKQSNRQRVAQISKKTETVLQLADKLERLADQLEGSGLSAIAEKLETFNEKLSGMPEQIAQMQSVSDKKLNAWISQVNQALSSIELSPQFQVDAPNVEVTAPSVDLSPITNLVSGIEKSINSAVGSIKMPEQEDRTDELKEAMEEVRDAINGLIFPVAEFPTTVKVTNTDGSAVGGGIQYTEGDVDATITGQAMLWEDTGDTLRAVSANKPLPVSDAGGTISVDDGAGSLTVDGTVAATQSGTWDVNNVSGTVSLPTGAATETTLSSLNSKVTAVNTGAVTIATNAIPPMQTASGSLTGSAQAVTFTMAGEANVTWQLTGTWTATVTFEASNDNSNWTTIYASRTGDNTISTTVVNSTNNDIYRNTTSGFKYVRLRCSAYTSGTIVVTGYAGAGASGVFLNFPLPTGSNTIGTVTAQGNVAHDGADSGNPQKIGTKAIAQSSAQTLVAANDRSNVFSDLDGQVLVRANAPIGDYVSGTASNTDGSSTQVLAAGAAGIKHYITDVSIANTSASNIYVELKDGTTAKWVFPVPANGGVTHSFTTPLGGTAATAWNFDPSAATTTVYCSASGFKSKI